MTNEELVKAYQEGNKEAMDRIVEQNKGLVNLIVNQYYNLSEISYLDRDDLEQVCYIGLMEAVRGFDHSLGFKFTSYASTAIKGQISRGLRVSSPWEKRSDRESDLCNIVSAHQYLPGSDDMTYMDMIEDPAAKNAYSLALEEMDRLILRDDLFDVLDRVFNPDDMEKNVIILKYGLNGHAYTAKEIGELYDVSPERAHQWSVKGLRRIRSSNAGRVLQKKYMYEYGMAQRMERLSRLEYKDPAYYVWERMQMEKMLEA